MSTLEQRPELDAVMHRRHGGAALCLSAKLGTRGKGDAGNLTRLRVYQELAGALATTGYVTKLTHHFHRATQVIVF